MKKEALENINSDLFDSFNPDEELWVVGGTTCVGGSATGTPAGTDWDVNGDWDHSEEDS